MISFNRYACFSLKEYTHYKFGEGEITNVDSTTYSIPMVTVRLDVGDFAGETIIRSADEWEKVI